jgi:hypothetical protein
MNAQRRTAYHVKRQGLKNHDICHTEYVSSSKCFFTETLVVRQQDGSMLRKHCSALILRETDDSHEVQRKYESIFNLTDRRSLMTRDSRCQLQRLQSPAERYSNQWVNTEIEDIP